MAAQHPSTTLLRRRTAFAAGGLGAAAVGIRGVNAIAPRLRGSVAHAQEAPAAGALRVPPLLAPPEEDGWKIFHLTLQSGQMEFVPGQAVGTVGINGPYLGQVLRA